MSASGRRSDGGRWCAWHPTGKSLDRFPAVLWHHVDVAAVDRHRPAPVGTVTRGFRPRLHLDPQHGVAQGSWVRVGAAPGDYDPELPSGKLLDAEAERSRRGLQRGEHQDGGEHDSGIIGPPLPRQIAVAKRVTAREMRRANG